MENSDLFSGLEKEKVFTRNPFFLPGRYVVQIDKVKLIDTRTKGKAWVIEALILESDNADRRAGVHATQMIMANTDSFKRNVKAFVYALNKVPKELSDPDDVDEAMVWEIVGEDNPACGQILRLEAVITKTKKGGDFTLHNWYPGEDSDWDKYGPTADAA